MIESFTGSRLLCMGRGARLCSNGIDFYFSGVLEACVKSVETDDQGRARAADVMLWRHSELDWEIFFNSLAT
jgi:hypothetical protein